MGQQGEGGSSNVFSMFEQSQIQEYKEAFTIIDQNRDGIISKDDLRDVLATMGQLNVKNEELEAMVKEASGPINFTVFLTMFGEKLKGADPEDVIVSAINSTPSSPTPCFLTHARTPARSFRLPAH